jgi:hypothetical protein
MPSGRPFIPAGAPMLLVAGTSARARGNRPAPHARSRWPPLLSDVLLDELQVGPLTRDEVRVPADQLVHRAEGGTPDVVRHVPAERAHPIQRITEHHDLGIVIFSLVRPPHAPLKSPINDVIIDARVASGQAHQREFDVLQDVDMIARHVFHAGLGLAIVLVRMNDVAILEESLGKLA